MAKKKDEFEEFDALVNRMHNCGDLKVFKDFIEALRNECKYRRYGDDTIMNPQLLTSVSGEEKSYDNILEFCKNALED